VADGSKKGWLAAGLSAEGSSLVRGLDTARLSPATASALVWYLRNSLYFELGLAGRRDVLLVLYERLLDDPERELRRVCRSLELPYRERMSAHVGPRPAPLTGRLAIDPAIRERCDELERRFARELEDARDPVASLSWKREPLDGG